jgi:hypothetical protein
MMRSYTACGPALVALMVSGMLLVCKVPVAHAQGSSRTYVAQTAHDAGNRLRVMVVSEDGASVGCPTSRISNGYIIGIGRRGSYLPVRLWGGVATPTTASVCIKNVTGVTQYMTACFATPLRLDPGATAALSGMVSGLYICGLQSNPNSLVIIHVI